MKTGLELIALERRAQQRKHGYTISHDLEHTDGALAKVAAILATNGTDAFVKSLLDGEFETGKDIWGLEAKLDGEENDIHRLAVAGALIAAEIDRIQHSEKINRIHSETNKPKMKTVADKVKEIVIDKLGVDGDEVVPDASFVNDLGADTLDMVELIMEFELKFQIVIPDEKAEEITTVGQAITYIENH